MTNNDLTSEYVRARLDYDPLTGIFTHRMHPDIHPNVVFRVGATAGNIVNKPNGKQYVQIKITNIQTGKAKLYKAHRLAHLIMTGEWPEDEIDHEDGDGLNNRWLNLRPATTSQNQMNVGVRSDNKTGFKGVSYSVKFNKYLAQIIIDGKRRQLGYRATAEEARDLYIAAAEKHHGVFARLN